MNACRADFIMMDSVTADSNVPMAYGSSPESLSNLTDIFWLEDVACEECCSVTSLSAYFADLLKLLSNTAPLGASFPDDTLLGSRNCLLNLLSARRPDLRNLETTCQNPQTLISHINLVNEILESFIRHKSQHLLPSAALGQQDSIRAFSTPLDVGQNDIAEGHSDVPVYRPGNTDYEVYSKVISEQLFPLTSFPYNQARDVII